LIVSGSSTFTNIGPAIFSGSVNSQGGFTGSLQGTASFATTASFALAVAGGGGAAFPFTGSARITGSLDVIGSTTITGSLNVSAGITGSLLGTASFATSASRAISSSFATTAQTLLGSVSTASYVINTVTGTSSADLVYGNMADNDQFRIRIGGTATNAGFAEIATADDGTEPIHVRQYSGVFTSLVRTATLLDGSGNSSFPGGVTATSFTGSLQGTASFALTASKAPNAALSMFGNLAGTGFTHPVITYIPIGTTTVSATESQRQIATPQAGTLKNIYIRTNSAAVATSFTTFTIRVNGVATNVKINISGGQAAGLYSDTINSASVVLGDEISLQVSTSIANGPQVNQYSFGIFNT
jgi:hypothetical protein